MNKKQITEGNVLIAEFIGLKRGWWISQEKPLTEDKKQWCDLDGKTFLGSRVYFDNDLKFHKLWDWLMPVVEKIELTKTLDTVHKVPVPTNVHINKSEENDNTKLKHQCIIQQFTWDGHRIEIFGKNKIQTVYNAVIEFIKWYNEQKK